MVSKQIAGVPLSIPFLFFLSCLFYMCIFCLLFVSLHSLLTFVRYPCKILLCKYLFPVDAFGSVGARSGTVAPLSPFAFKGGEEAASLLRVFSPSAVSEGEKSRELETSAFVEWRKAETRGETKRWKEEGSPQSERKKENVERKISQRTKNEQTNKLEESPSVLM